MMVNTMTKMSTVEGVCASEIGEVCTESVVVEDDGRKHFICSIIRVLFYGQFHSCLICGVKVQETSISGIVQCTKCDMKQKIEHCKQKASAKLMIESLGDKVLKTVTMFNDVLNHSLALSDGAEDDAEARLLNLPAMAFEINSQNVGVQVTPVPEQEESDQAILLKRTIVTAPMHYINYCFCSLTMM